MYVRTNGRRRPRRRRIGRWILGLAVVLVVAAAIVVLRPPHDEPLPAPTGSDAERVERGRYLTAAADCEVCHTAPGGTPFAGGRAMPLPFGTLYTPNITPDADTGIGRWSERDFLVALHQGRAPDGRRYYPAFPYASYTALTAEDALAIRAYLLSLAPVRNAVPPNALRFPFDQRWGIAFWNLLYNPDRRFADDSTRSAEWNRGAYLAEALGHCQECHSPRNVAYAIDRGRAYAGASVDGWKAYNLSDDPARGLGTWSIDDVQAYLARGYAPGRGAAGGPMASVVQYSLSRLTPDDTHALATYLKALPPQPDAVAAPRTARAAAPADDAARRALGATLYAASCAGCHGDDDVIGALAPGTDLRGHRSVADPAGTNLFRALEEGVTLQTARTDYHMPAFAVLTTAEMEALCRYVLERHGTPDPICVRPERP